MQCFLDIRIYNFVLILLNYKLLASFPMNSQCLYDDTFQMTFSSCIMIYAFRDIFHELKDN